MSMAALIEKTEPIVRHSFFASNYSMQDVMDIIEDAYEILYTEGRIEETSIPTLGDIFSMVETNAMTYILDRALYNRDVFWSGTNIAEEYESHLNASLEDYDSEQEYDDRMTEYEMSLCDIHSYSGGFEIDDDGFGSMLASDIKMVLDLGNYTYLDMNVISEELPSGIVVQRKKIINDPVCEVW